jgi:hypothetical protein
LTNVVSFAGGIWHSAAVTSDGAVWLWGSNGKSQLCDGTPANRPAPQRVSMPGGAKVVRVTAGGFGTLMQTSDGALYACGDNQFGGLGAGTPIVLKHTDENHDTCRDDGCAGRRRQLRAVSVDGCSVRLTGDSGEGVVAPTGYGSRTFVPRTALTLCGTHATTTVADVVNPAPKGGASGCWAPTVNRRGGESTIPGLRQAMVAAENVVRRTRRSWRRSSRYGGARRCPPGRRRRAALAYTSKSYRSGKATACASGRPSAA